MGIAILAITAVDTFSQTGFQDALIQKNNDIDDYLNTTWTVSSIRGFLIFVLLFISAPNIAQYFGNTAASPIIKVLSISQLLIGMTNTGVIYFQKELEFNKQFIYEFSGTLTDLIVSLTVALLLRNVWALAFGLLTRNIVNFIMSYIIHPFRPRIRIDKGKVIELYSFGKWLLASGILFFLVNHGDDIILGRILGVTALGLYQMAYRISELPVTEITNVVNRVTFPAFSIVQKDYEKLKLYFLQTLELTAVVIFPLSIGLIILGPEITKVFLGDGWNEMVPALQVLAIYGLIQSISATAGTLFRAVGRPQIGFFMNAIRFLFILIVIIPFTNNFGIMGTAASIVVGAIVKIPIFLVFVNRLINISISDVLKVIKYPLYISLLAGFTTVTFHNLIHLSGLTIFLAESACFLIMFLTASYFIWRKSGEGPISSLRLLI